jgi:hypothetical protein
MGLGRRERTGHTTSSFVGLRFRVQSSEVRGYGLGLALLRGNHLAFHCLKPCAGRGSSFQGLIPAIAQARAHHGPPESATRKAADLGARGAGSDAGCRALEFIIHGQRCRCVTGEARRRARAKGRRRAFPPVRAPAAAVSVYYNIHHSSSDRGPEQAGTCTLASEYRF